jgi:hypothetical protein
MSANDPQKKNSQDIIGVRNRVTAVEQKVNAGRSGNVQITIPALTIGGTNGYIRFRDGIMVESQQPT